MDQKKHFVTYGDGLFTNQRERLKQEAIDSALFDYVHTFQKDDIKEFVQQHSYAFNHIPGAGFIWKPKIIIDLLHKVEKYDIVFYCDAGSCMVNQGEWKFLREERFQFYVCLMNNSVLPISAFAGWVLEHGDYTSGTRYDVENKIPFYTNRPNFNEYLLDKFDLSNNQHFLDYPAVEAGCIIVRKTPQTIQFLETWLNTMVENHYDLLLNHNMNDQTILNALMYKYHAPRIDGRDFYGEGPFFAARFTDNGQKEGYYLPTI